MNKQIIIHLAPLLLLPGLVGCSGLASPLEAVVSTQSPPAITIQAPPSNAVTTHQAVGSSDEVVTAIEQSLEDIYTNVNPSVVNIQITQKVEAPAVSQFPDFPFFFNPQDRNGQPSQEPQPFYQHGAGSGFVWDKAGHIVTNNHVVEGADKIEVTFADDTTVAAEVVGADPDSDLAVLKVDVPADQLQPVQLADSTQLKVGQLAVAIGNPFGLEGTMTVGFVSALGRLLPVSSGVEQTLLNPGPTFTIPDIIQTDAPINPGNSGGVLVNDQGQVIGVTAAIESPVRASAGVGFAIPAAVVDQVVPALISDGHYDHPWLGLSGITLNPELVDAMNLKSDQHGVLVIDVTPNSPADQAGLQGSDRQMEIEDRQIRVGGDIIVAVDGQPVKSFDDVVTYLAHSTEVNQTITLTVLRDGQEETVKATLAARPQHELSGQQSEDQITGGVRLGIEGVDLTPEIAQAMDLPANQKGVLVERIQLGSPADAAHLNGSYKSATINGRPLPVGGDVITAIDGQPVERIEDIQAFMQQAEPDQQVALTILRDGKEMDVFVTLTAIDQPIAQRSNGS